MPANTPSPAGLKPPSRAQAILKGKCPRCRRGDLMKSPSLIGKNFGEMNKACGHCKQDFVIEPGFYWGAMYISYAVNVAVIVISLVTYLLFFSSYSEFWVIGVIVVLIAALIPINYRYGKIIMIHFFAQIKFDQAKFYQVDVENLEVDFRKNRKIESEEL